MASRLWWFLPLLLDTVAGSPAWPRFSWSSVPTFYHSCNLSGRFTDEAISFMARFPLVTVEKGQGVRDPTDRRYAEEKILETLRRVKAVDANVSTIFYYNSIMDWPFYRLHHDFVVHPQWWLKRPGGSVCRQMGDCSFPNCTGLLAFDFAQTAARDFWARECLNMTRSGFVDGCFSDRAPDTPCGAGADYQEGHVLVHQQLQARLGGGLLIANAGVDMPGVSGAMIEFFGPDEESIQKLLRSVALGKVVLAHAQCGGGGAAITDSLAAFLVAAGPYSYYGCSNGWSVQTDPITQAWRPEYNQALGVPRGPAVKVSGIYRRTFIHEAGATEVTFDTTEKEGFIRWAGGRPSSLPDSTLLV